MSYALGEYAYLFKALSDETRLRIFSLLSDEEICACKLLEQVNITQPTLSYHMKLLCGSGLVNGRKDGPWMRYTVNRERQSLLLSFLQCANTPGDLGGADNSCGQGATAPGRA